MAIEGEFARGWDVGIRHLFCSEEHAEAWEEESYYGLEATREVPIEEVSPAHRYCEYCKATLK